MSRDFKNGFWDRLTGDQKVQLVLWGEAIMLTIIAVVFLLIMM